MLGMTSTSSSTKLKGTIARAAGLYAAQPPGQILGALPHSVRPVWALRGSKLLPRPMLPLLAVRMPMATTCPQSQCRLEKPTCSGSITTPCPPGTAPGGKRMGLPCCWTLIRRRWSAKPISCPPCASSRTRQLIGCNWNCSCPLPRPLRPSYRMRSASKSPLPATMALPANTPTHCLLKSGCPGFTG